MSRHAAPGGTDAAASATSPVEHRASLAAIVVLGVATLGTLLYVGRGTLPYFDEWTWIFGRRGLSADTFLAAHNGHLSVVPVVLYKASLETVGIVPHWPLRLLLALEHLAVAALVHRYAIRRTSPAGAAIAAGLMLVLGSAADDLLWPFQIGFLTSCLAGVAMLLALDRRDRRGDVLAAAALAVALGSSALGLVFVVLATVELAIGRSWRRSPVVAAPLAAYAAWYVAFGGGGAAAQPAGIADGVTFAARMGAAAAGGLLGLGATGGTLVLCLVAVLVVGALLRRRSAMPRLVALAAAAPALWALTAAARGGLGGVFGDPEASRYVYAGALLLVLLVVEAAPRAARTRPWVAVLGAALLVLAVVGNLPVLLRQGETQRADGEIVRGQFAALPLLADDVGAGYEPSPGLGFGYWSAPVVRDAERDYGRIAPPASAIPGLPERSRKAADDALIRADQPLVRVVPRTATGACDAVRPDATLLLPAGRTLVLRSDDPVRLRLSRFGPPGRTADREVTAGTIVLRARADGAATPWRVVVRGRAAVERCAPRRDA